MNEQDQPQEDPLVLALKKLRTLPDFQLVVEHIRQERESWITGLCDITTPEMAIKNAGSIVAVDMILTMITGD